MIYISSENVRIIPKYSNKKKTTDEYKKELEIKNPNVEVLEEYINAKTKILHRYKDCGHIAKVVPSRLLYGSGCDMCNRKHVGDRCRKSNEDYVKELKNKNPDIIALEDYKGANIKIMHKHLVCGNVWKVVPSSILQGTGCPKCVIKINAQKRTLCECDFLKRIDSNITILSPYINNYTYVSCKCNKCKHIWNARPSDLMQGKGCPKCAGNIKKTHEQFILEVNDKLNSDVMIIGQYNGMNKPIKCQCKICNHCFNSTPERLMIGNGCKKCADKRSGVLKRKTNEKFLEELHLIHENNIKILDQYKGADVKLQCKCTICGHKWHTSPGSLIYCKSGCPKCASSKGEKLVQTYLNILNIEYIHQYRYSGLVGTKGKKLSYDFYLPYYNLLIECQGEQHKHPIKYFGGEKQFIIQQEHDRRKRKYAKEHNIHLLEIWYNEIDNIPQIITKTLNNLKLESVETVISA